MHDIKHVHRTHRAVGFVRIEENTLHIDINRRFFMFIVALSCQVIRYTHAHTLHKTSFNGAFAFLLHHHFHLCTSTNRESSMKQTTFYLPNHLK